MRCALVVFCVVTCFGGALASEGGPPAKRSPAEKLHAIFEAEWEWALKTNPVWASELGDLRYNDRWPDASLDAICARHAHRRDVLRQLDAIDTGALDKADAVNYRLFRREYEQEVEAYPFGWHLLPITQLGGVQDASRLADLIPFARVEHYEDWIARLETLRTYVDQTIGLMRAGIEAKRVHPRVVMQRVPPQIRRQIVDDPAESLFFKPLAAMPETIEPPERRRLVGEAKAAIADEVVPAYRRLAEFFETEYVPACFEEVGVWQMPRGKELYALKAREFTTTELSPREIHEIGRKEVARIRGEMDEVLRRVEWEGTFPEFLEHLRTDPKFYYTDAEDLLRANRAVCKRIDPGLVKLFGRLPRTPYGVEPIPAHLAPDTTAAFYQPPAADGTRAGMYCVNLYQPESRPKYEIEVLASHEAVPGHHLQIALAMELDDLPNFRRYTGYTAYVEGWALYSEGLGEELGLYQEPYSKFGQLTYEMWRAVRLVVDTGIHSFRWDRQRAIDYFLANTAKTRLDVENEVDRYIVWPGQALAYKIGELKIRALRSRAERELGERFDVRAFHDVVLASGAVTLDVLEANVDAWIADSGPMDR